LSIYSLTATLLFAATSAGAQERGGAGQSAPITSVTSSVESPSAVPPSIPSYADGTKGLEYLVKDMLKLEKEGDQQRLAAYEKSLALPDPDNWFTSVFGDELGSRMSVISAPMRMDSLVHTADMLAAQLQEKRTEIQVVQFGGSCNADATATEYPFLLLRKTPERLYDVRFLGTNSASLWAYFAYVNGSFRFIGNLKKKEIVESGERPRPPSSLPVERIRVGGNVAAAKLTHLVQPVYPDEAKARHIQGKVLLHAIIAKDGSVQDLYLEEGQCWLSEAAMAAVKQWRYAPTLLQGRPVEVDTTIQVIFTIGQ